MKNWIRTRRDEMGFTLIELLIVIVVLGILTGVTVLAVGGFETAAEDKCTKVSDKADTVIDVAQSELGNGSYGTKSTTC